MFLRSAGAGTKVYVDIKKDLNSYVNFLKHFKGTVMFDNSNPKLQVFGDISTLGMGE